MTSLPTPSRAGSASVSATGGRSQPDGGSDLQPDAPAERRFGPFLLTTLLMTGDTVNITVKLIAPVALEDKMNFAIREGGRTVGAGVVTKIVK